ncbi:hypothetical protein SLA2020_076230 [Shorea laevis]
MLRCENDGLGVPNLKLRNLALLRKWWARYEEEAGNLWKRGGDEKWLQRRWVGWDRKHIISKVYGRTFCLWVGKEVSGEIIGESFKREVGEGERIRFWDDVWVGKSERLCQEIL